MNTHIESLEFWQTVQHEYNIDEGGTTIICSRSSTFRQAWTNQAFRTRVRQLAAEFLKLSPAFSELFTANASSFLFKEFESSNTLPDDQWIIVRREFINWNIQRLSKTN